MVAVVTGVARWWWRVVSRDHDWACIVFNCLRMFYDTCLFAQCLTLHSALLANFIKCFCTFTNSQLGIAFPNGHFILCF